MADARSDVDARRTSFLSNAEEYERYRPGYPEAAIEWVVGRSAQRVIDIGCGPGNLTGRLRELGHDVVGVDRSAAMLTRARNKRLRVVVGAAEALPIADASGDVVTAATAFHWFDHERAVPEIRRVLVASGRIALLTNVRDESVPWVEGLSEIIGSEAAMPVTLGGAEGMESDFTEKLEQAGLFNSTEWRVFDHAHELTPEALVGLVRSRSYIAILADEEREQVLAEVRNLCREHPDLREMSSFLMPYKTHACRSFAAKLTRRPPSS